MCSSMRPSVDISVGGDNSDVGVGAGTSPTISLVASVNDTKSVNTNTESSALSHDSALHAHSRMPSASLLCLGSNGSALLSQHVTSD